MGLAKRLLDEPYWFLDDRKICSSCFTDNGIKSYIESHSDKVNCDFCNKSDIKSLTFSKLMDFIHGRICEKYSSLESALAPYEGGFVFEGQSIGDLLSDDLKPGVNTDEVYNEITECLADHNWIENEWNAPDDPQFNTEPYFNWKYFCRYVKTKRRFFFNSTKSSRIIDVLKRLIEKQNLIKKLNPGTVFYRARAFKKGVSVPKYNVKNLGPPQPEDIMDKSSRMSPSGIPIFYCSDKQEIAVKEISDQNRTGYALIGKFELRKEIYIVDFSGSDEMKIPSYFDENISLKERDELIFLKQFQNEISKPIKKDGREHTEYAPTQIITEFLKNMQTQNNQKIKGIGYKSAVGLGKSYSLFFKRGYNDELLPEEFLFLDASFNKKVEMPCLI